MTWTRWCILSGTCAAALIFMAAEPGDPQPVSESAHLTISPEWIRVAIDDGGPRRRTLPITLTTDSDTKLMTASGDCHCIQLADTLPLALPTGSTTVHVDILAITAGVKYLTFRTPLGQATVHVQLVGKGLGSGATEYAAMIAQAHKLNASVWLIMANLQGAIQNCGCGPGSLGGINYIAALPAALARDLGQSHNRCILLGDTAGEHPTLPHALTTYGWSTASDAIALHANQEALNDPAISIIIDATTTLNHRKIIQPAGSHGMTVIACFIDQHGQCVGSRLIPIDRTLPSQPDILTGFTEPVVPVRTDANSSARCAACHPTAMALWQNSPHARAFASLPPDQRTASCVPCHTHADNLNAPAHANVQCQSCHVGSDAHADQPATTRTQGTLDCRTCHDQRHHPDFERSAAWRLIAHGKE